MMPLLDKLREQYGVGPVCSELHIAPSTYYHCQQQRHHPDKRSARAQHDDWLKREIQRVYDENHQVYGVRKVWRQLLREGIRVARCTVARLMAVMGLAGVLRGKKVRTTISRKAVAAGDRVNRQFVAERPDQLWVADFTYVSTWQGFVYVAFIIDVFAGCIVGGESHRLWKRHSCWMHWSRRCGPVGRPAQSITVIKVLSMYHWPIRSD
ncbi:transposase [Escherichia coli PA40]|nr:transposase [Escherichia coli PA40]